MTVRLFDVITCSLAEAALFVAAGFAALATNRISQTASMWVIALGFVFVTMLSKHIRLQFGLDYRSTSEAVPRVTIGEAGVQYALVLPAMLWDAQYVMRELGAAPPSEDQGLALSLLVDMYVYCGPFAFIVGMLITAWLRRA